MGVEYIFPVQRILKGQSYQAGQYESCYRHGQNLTRNSNVDASESKFSVTAAEHRIGRCLVRGVGRTLNVNEARPRPERVPRAGGERRRSGGRW